MTMRLFGLLKERGQRIFKTGVVLLRDSVGLPPKTHNSNSWLNRQRSKLPDPTQVHVCVFRALRRLRRTRTVCFLRIWRQTESRPLLFRLFQTHFLIGSTFDLVYTLILFFLFYVASSNFVARSFHLVIIMFVIALVKITDSILPLCFFYFLNGLVLINWLFCFLPLYRNWLYYNLSYASVTQLGGDLPGNWAWKSLAMLFGYLMVRMLETSIRDYRVLDTTSRILKESGLDFSAEDFINTCLQLREVTPTYHDIAETFLANCVMSCVNFIQLLLTLVF